MLTNSITGKSILSLLISLTINAIIWFYPVPGGLTPQAWHMFAISAVTIAVVLTQPFPPGAVMLIVLYVAIFTKTSPETKMLPGFTSGTVWLIFCAYVLLLGSVTSGLGRRIVYKVLSLFGDSSLGIAYSLGVSGLITVLAIPSVTAQPGGIISPIARSIDDMLGSAPGVTGRRIGDSLTIVCSQFTPITGAIFLTGIAANPLAAGLVKSSLGMEIIWGGQFTSVAVPVTICFCLMPPPVYRLLDSELKHASEVGAMGKQAFDELGSMSSDEKKVTFGLVLALVSRDTSLITGLSTISVGLGLTAYLFASGTVSWKSLLNDYAAWDMVIRFSVIIGLAAGLVGLGFIKWITIKLGSGIQGSGVIESSIVLGILYTYVHYLFATAAGHVAALYALLAVTTIVAGVPSMMVAICFGIFSNLIWRNAEYGGGPGPIYFAQGHFERPRSYKTNLCVVTINVIIIFMVGML